jgi:rhodanese-related sulfurtransferase
MDAGLWRQAFPRANDPSSGLSFARSTGREVTRLDPRDAYTNREQYQFIDVRQAYEFEAGHVDGAVHITLQEVPARYEELDRGRPVVVTCQVGQRSALAAEFLSHKGFAAHNLEGGLDSWVNEGLPLVASEGARGDVVDGYAETLDWKRP